MLGDGIRKGMQRIYRARPSCHTSDFAILPIDNRLHFEQSDNTALLDPKNPRQRADLFCDNFAD
jgi:hypothetical protein